MAAPASFPESDRVLSKPAGMSDEECSCLSVLAIENDHGVPFVISCWKFTAAELAEINRTGRLWLGVAGYTMPPVFVTGLKPFELV